MASTPELSARSLITGCALGALLAAGNVYMSLKTGWAETGNIMSAMLGFAICAGAAGGREKYSRLENNITQVTAVAAGSMSYTAGLVASLPALWLLEHRSFSPWGIALWGLALGILGTFVGVLLRRQLIVEERLPYPTGSATAEVIDALHAAGRGAARGTRALLLSAGVAAALTWFRDAARPAWIPAMTALPVRFGGTPAKTLGVGLSWSPMLFGIGVFIGPRNGISLLGGAVAGWVILAPWLLARRIVPDADYATLGRWLMCPGIGLLLAAAIVPLVSRWRALGTGLADLGRSSGKAGAWRWLVIVAAACVVVVVTGWLLLGLPPILSLAALVPAALLAAVCARASGQTDIAPITQMGQVTQLGLGVVAPSRAPQNLVASSIVEGTATQATSLLHAFRAGERLGASWRPLVLAQLVGIVVGIAVVVPIYFLVTRIYPLGSNALPAPPAVAAMGIANLIRNGFGSLPQYAALAGGIAFAAGCGFAVLEQTRLARLAPSAVAVGVGLLAPASYAAAICLGSLIAWGLRSQSRLPAIAAGAIGGESVTGVLITILLALGVLRPGTH